MPEVAFPEIGRGRYGVDRDGNAYSLINGRLRLLKPAYPSGYATIFLCFKGEKKKRVRVHRMVAMAFLPTDPSKPHVNHKNGIKADNRASNLEWVSPSENSRHALATGLYWPPMRFAKSDWTEARKMRRDGYLFREIAEKLGCSMATAHRLANARPPALAHP